MGDLEAIGYYVIVAAEGHNTTSATVAHGLHALIQFPGQLERLRSDRGLVPKHLPIRYETLLGTACRHADFIGLGEVGRQRQHRLDVTCPNLEARLNRRRARVEQTKSSRDQKAQGYPVAS
jgi:hypothetical protein